MNILTWIIQIFLALHTAIGAFWKFSHSAEQTMPSLKAIPETVWLSLSGFEILCSLGLILPLFIQRFTHLAVFAAVGIAVEMLVFCLLHLNSGDPSFGPVIYWVIVAVLCSFIALRRINRNE